MHMHVHLRLLPALLAMCSREKGVQTSLLACLSSTFGRGQDTKQPSIAHVLVA
jgi:hypothetical protein